MVTIAHHEWGQASEIRVLEASEEGYRNRCFSTALFMPAHPPALRRTNPLIGLALSMIACIVPQERALAGQYTVTSTSYTGGTLTVSPAS